MPGIVHAVWIIRHAGRNPPGALYRLPARGRSAHRVERVRPRRRAWTGSNPRHSLFASADGLIGLLRALHFLAIRALYILFEARRLKMATGIAPGNGGQILYRPARRLVAGAQDAFDFVFKSTSATRGFEKASKQWPS